MIKYWMGWGEMAEMEGMTGLGLEGIEIILASSSGGINGSVGLSSASLRRRRRFLRIRTGIGLGNWCCWLGIRSFSCRCWTIPQKDEQLCGPLTSFP